MTYAKLVTSILTAGAVAGAIGVTVAHAQTAQTEAGVGGNNVNSTGVIRPVQNQRPEASQNQSAPTPPAAAPMQERTPRADRG